VVRRGGGPGAGKTGLVTLTVVRISPSHSAFGAVAVLFDDYRAHYGWPPSPQLTHDWLHAQVTRQAMMITAALRAGRACGFIAASVMPASLALGIAWSVRDLYVAPPHRRVGIARALLQQVMDDARQAGAHRVSLQTETGNTAALTLYAGAGFQPVTGLELLSVDLARDRQDPRGTL
jgi:ribosomal protein S18 acetylase RimI-like enzyme